ncbi:MAG: hypothetical protein WCQ99_09550 [Pseudomonadota bacterium]
MDERRKNIRLEKEYHLEYGPFSALINQDALKSSSLVNLSSGGVMFCADESFPVGAQLFLKIHIAGWAHENGAPAKVEDTGSELVLRTIAEVLRVDFDAAIKCYFIGAKFLGEVHS